jgi:hypothetical protein
MVEIGLASKFGKEAAAAVIGKSISNSTRQTLKQIVNGKLNSARGHKDAFWTAQELTLVDIGDAQNTKFIDQEYLLWRATDGPAQAAAMRAALENAHANAFTVQYVKTLDEWTNMIALKHYGANSHGEPSLDKRGKSNRLGPFSHGTEKGLLHLDVRLDMVAPNAPLNFVTIEKASVSGLNSTLRKELKGRLVGDVRMTKLIHGRVNTLVLQGSSRAHLLNFAVHPSGRVVWSSSIGETAKDWLTKLADIRSPNGRLYGMQGLAAAMRNLVADDMKDLELPNVGG